MNFLSVLCVVLYFRSGDFFQIQNNAPHPQYESQGIDQFASQRNIAIPSINTGYDNAGESQINTRLVGQFNSQDNLRFQPPHISPEYINSQQFQQINGQLLNPQENINLHNQNFQDHSANVNTQHLLSAYINPQELHSVYVNPEVRRINEAQLNQEGVDLRPKSQLQGSLQYVRQQIYKQPAQHTLDINSEIKPTLAYPKNINIQSINSENIVPFTTNEDTKLQLQGMSPELIQSLINQNNIRPKTLNSVQPLVSLPKSFERNIENREPLNNNEYRFEQNRARFDSPSAEVLYDMKQALPYNIQRHQLPNISRGEVTFTNNVLSTRKIEDIIRSTPPMKRYMVIHPDGRVEHVDDLEKITKVHPNYSKIKSQDVLKYLNSKASIPGSQIQQPKPTLPISNNEQFSTIHQELNPVQHLTVEQHMNELLVPQKLNPIPSKNTVATLSMATSVPNATPTKILSAVDATIKNDVNLPISSSLQEINKTLSQKISQNNTSNSLVASSIAQNGSGLKTELTITHSTPIIKTQEIQYSFDNNNQQTSSSTENNNNKTAVTSSTPLTSSTVLTTTEKSEGIKNHTQVQEVNYEISDNSSNSPKDKVDIYKSEHETPPISQIASVVQISGQNFSSAISKSNPRADNSKKEVTHDVEPDKQPANINVSSTTGFNTPPGSYLSNETSQYVNNNDTTTNLSFISSETPTLSSSSQVPSNEQLNTNSNVTIKEIPSEAVNKTSPSVNMTNSGGFWFQADDHFWDNITNNNDAQNLFYFLFAPPKPSIEKETKTTFYANGTVVEEISETRDKDGVPTVVRTTKVSHANSTTTAV